MEEVRGEARGWEGSGGGWDGKVRGMVRTVRTAETKKKRRKKEGDGHERTGKGFLALIVPRRDKEHNVC